MRCNNITTTTTNSNINKTSSSGSHRTSEETPSSLSIQSNVNSNNNTNNNNSSNEFVRNNFSINHQFLNGKDFGLKLSQEFYEQQNKFFYNQQASLPPPAPPLPPPPPQSHYFFKPNINSIHHSHNTNAVLFNQIQQTNNFLFPPALASSSPTLNTKTDFFPHRINDIVSPSASLHPEIKKQKPNESKLCSGNKGYLLIFVFIAKTT
jgi:hypothetical protein